MTYLFIGGEDHDFTKLGGCVVNTATTAARRTAYARCSLEVDSTSATDGWQGAFSAPASTFWFTGRVYHNNCGPGTLGDIFSVLDGTTRRLVLKMSASNGKYQLIKRTAAGTNTTLATAAPNIPPNVLYKLDLFVDYGAGGRVQLYADGTLLIDYSGDVTTDGATALSGFVLGSVAGSGATTYASLWSEIIAATQDTRALSLVTLPPSGAGATWAWTGAYTDLNEVTTNDATLCTSANPDETALVAVNTAGITGNPAVLAVCVSARAQKGGTGPQNGQLVVRTGGNDYPGGAQPLPAALARIANVWESNPATAGPWAPGDLTAAGFNIGIKSLA